MTARDNLVAALQGLALDASIIPYSRSLEGLSKNTVMVRVDEVRPSSNPQAWREYQFALLVMTPVEDPTEAEKELDAFLEDVLLALDESDLPMWSSATRVSVEERFHGYQVDLTVTFQKGGE